MRFRGWALTTWLALGGVAAITVSVEYLPHTDDGCSVETHCLACRTSLGRAATTVTVTALPAPVGFIEALPAIELPAPEIVGLRPAESRGPPLP